MSHIIHRNLRQMPPTAVGGEGIVLRDSTGKTYLDASSGAAVSSLGHGHPDVIAAMHRQVDRALFAEQRQRVRVHAVRYFLGLVQRDAEIVHHRLVDQHVRGPRPRCNRWNH